MTIAPGGSVTFADAGTATNLAWTGTAPICEPGVPVAPASPETGWEGKCAFAAPGTYRFESSTLWPEYTRYEVVVEGSAGGTPGEGGPKPGGAPGTGTPGTTPPGASSTRSPLSGSPRISRRQRGATVKGSLQVSVDGAADRLEIDLVAGATAFGKDGHATRVVGRSVSASVGAGRRSFSVKLDASAREVLDREHRLALTVRITLTPPGREATVFTRSVDLRE